MSKPIIVTGVLLGFIGFQSTVAELNRRGHRELILCKIRLAKTASGRISWGCNMRDLVSPQLLLTRLESGQLR